MNQADQEAIETLYEGLEKAHVVLDEIHERLENGNYHGAGQLFEAQKRIADGGLEVCRLLAHSQAEDN